MEMISPVLPALLVPPFFLPRISIQHAHGALAFNDETLSTSELDNVILLGLIRQRVMWRQTDTALECKSYDYEHGKPTDEFPWEDSNFGTGPVAGAILKDTSLSCGACVFADWVADPTSAKRSKQPRCTEQYVVPMLVKPADEDRYRLGLATFQKSSMRPMKEYFKAFVKDRKPAYTMTTRMRVNVNLGSGFKYSVPTFQRNEEVDPGAYPVLSLLLRATRDSVTTPTPHRPRKTGGMLSVSAEDTSETVGFSGTFFN